MDQQLDIAIELIFKELIADTHKQNAEVATAAHSCVSTILAWKNLKLLEEEYRQAEIDQERYRI